MLYVGDDWAEDHHDLAVIDDAGKLAGRRRFSCDLAGMTELHEWLTELESDPSQVAVAIEVDRGLWVESLVAAGYQVYAINPLSVARYRERHTTSGAKSDPGDARVLADVARTDRHRHRQVAGDSTLAQAIKIRARSHLRLIRERVRNINALRAALRDYYPAALAAFGTALADRDAVAVLAKAPSPAQGRRLTRTQLEAALRRGGRQRNIRARAEQIQAALRSSQMETHDDIAAAYADTTAATVAILAELNRQIAQLESELETHFEQHPDAEIVRSQPGLGTVLGARVLGEFGDDPNRYADVKSRRNYAGTSPITVASGKYRGVYSRYKGNDRLRSSIDQWAFSALTASPGAYAYYRQLRDQRQLKHRQALRAVGNRLVGIRHGCLRHRTTYDEHTAWGHRNQPAA